MNPKHPKHALERPFRIALTALAIASFLAVTTAPADAGPGKKRARGRTSAVHCEPRYSTHHHRAHDRCDCTMRIRHGRPAWCTDPTAVVVWKNHPFFLHAGYGVYIGGAAITADIHDLPPAGRIYVDPFCHRPFASIAEYRMHVRHHPHTPLVQVMIDF
jgi:hypothetical protein